MANENFDGMIKLLRNSSFKFDTLISDDLLCVFCKNVLINAHQAPCGCKFCRLCIDKLIEHATEICPGSTEECRENVFSKNTNISVDYRTNNIIYKLKVKCPNESCNYECDFKSMNSHFEICKNSVLNKLKNDSDIETSCKDTELTILVNRLLDSVNQLKSEEESNKIEIEKLKESISKNNSMSVNSVVEIAKREIQKAKKLEENNLVNDLTNLKIGDGPHSAVIANLKRELRKRENEIATVNQEISSIKTAYSEDFKQRMEVYFNDKLASFVKDVKSIYENEMIQVRNGLSNKHMNGRATEINLSNENSNEKIGNSWDNKENIENGGETSNLVDPYVWSVNESLAKMNAETILDSADFFSQDKRYLLRLSLRSTSGDGEPASSEWSIDLCVIDEGCEVCEGFPMNRDVTINILDQANSAPFMTFRKTCSINKKEKICIAKFVGSDLVPEAADLKTDLIAIQCMV